MKACQFPPIRYNKRQVASLFRFLRFLNPGSAPTLDSLGLAPDGKGGFVWIPQ